MLKLAPVVLYALAAQSVIYVLTDDFPTAMFWSAIAGVAVGGIGWLWRQRTV